MRGSYENVGGVEGEGTEGGGGAFPARALTRWSAGWAAAATLGLAGYLAFGVAGLAVLPAGTTLPAGVLVALVPIVGAFALTLPALLVVHQGFGGAGGPEAVAAGQVELVAAGGRLALGLSPVLLVLGTAGGTGAARFLGGVTLFVLVSLVLVAGVLRRVDQDPPAEAGRAWLIGLAHAALAFAVGVALYAQVLA